MTTEPKPVTDEQLDAWRTSVIGLIASEALRLEGLSAALLALKIKCVWSFDLSVDQMGDRAHEAEAVRSATLDKLINHRVSAAAAREAKIDEIEIALMEHAGVRDIHVVADVADAIAAGRIPHVSITF